MAHSLGWFGYGVKGRWEHFAFPALGLLNKVELPETARNKKIKIGMPKALTEMFCENGLEIYQFIAIH
jgi:hypothetical protein